MSTPRALVCAPRMPEYDRESGSRRVFHLVEFLREAGWAVSFVAENAQGEERYHRALQRLGVASYAGPATMLAGDEYLPHLEDLISPGRFDVAIIAFWYLAEAFMPIIRRCSPRTSVIVDSIDLHFLRNARNTFFTGSASATLAPEVGHEMAREINAYAAADLVLTVSDKEAEIINDLVSRTEAAVTVPLSDDLPASPLPREHRRGSIFIGNFRHPPNIEAVDFLCTQILPLVDPALLEAHPVTIVGTDPTERVKRLVAATPWVQLAGWVPSVVPYLHHARVSLVPLLSGAGTKGKLIQALMVGTPSVSTKIGVEGLNLRHGEQVLVAQDAAEFAAQLERLLTDDALWDRLAATREAWARGEHGREGGRRRFLDAVDLAMAHRAKRMAREAEQSTQEQS